MLCKKCYNNTRLPVLFVPRPRSSLIGDGWNCDSVGGFRQLDSSTQWENLPRWQQLSAGDAPTGSSSSHRGRGAAPTGCSSAACQPYQAIKGPHHLLPLSWEGGDIPCEQLESGLRAADRWSHGWETKRGVWPPGPVPWRNPVSREPSQTSFLRRRDALTAERSGAGQRQWQNHGQEGD